MIWPFRRRDREPIGDPFAVDLEAAYLTSNARDIITNTIFVSDTRDAHKLATAVIDDLLAAGYGLTDGSGAGNELAREMLAENLELNRDLVAARGQNTALADQLSDARKLQGDLANANARVTELEAAVAALAAADQPTEPAQHRLGYRPAHQLSEMRQVQTLICGQPRSVCLRETARANQLAARLQGLTERQLAR
uniref:hypothetical protein n=1 Tax=Herbidospora sakaeratensis TaxID=564415 RepID=UPI000781AA52|nr:hypothetical protein [Herbidospora sakaeratensis]